MKTTSLTLLLVIIALAEITSQIPDNFQFLDLNDSNNLPEIFRVTDSDIIYSHIYGINGANEDYVNERKVSIASHFYLSSKLVEVNDSTFHIALWDLVELDIPRPGYALYSRKGKEEKIDEKYFGGIGTYKEIHPDLQGGVYAISSENELIHILEDGTSDTISMLSSSTGLYTDCIDELRFRDTDSSFKYRSYDEFNYECPDGFNLEKYSCDGSQFIHKWTLPDSLYDFSQIQFLQDNCLYMDVINDDHNYEIHKIDSASNAEVLHFDVLDPNESVLGVHVMSDSTHILFGEHQFKYSEHTFFRTVNSLHQTEYELADIEIDAYTVTQKGEELDFKLSVYNPTLDTITNVPAYFENLDNASWAKRLSFFISDIIYPGSTASDSFKLRPHDMESFIQSVNNIELEIPGADNKFLKSGPRYVSPDIITNTSTVQVNEQISLFPNPTNSIINIQGSSKINFIRIYYHSGKEMYSESLNGDMKIDIIDFPAGLYNCLVYSDNEVTPLSFIKL